MTNQNEEENKYQPLQDYVLIRNYVLLRLGMTQINKSNDLRTIFQEEDANRIHYNFYQIHLCEYETRMILYNHLKLLTLISFQKLNVYYLKGI